jgi:hypothetical protein
MADKQQRKQPTIDNADDAMLDAKARFDQWLVEFQAEWHRPQVETAAKMLWSSQPEQVRNYIRQSKPDAAKQMDSLFEKGR